MGKRTFYIAGPIFGMGPDRNYGEFQHTAKLAENQLMCATLIPHDIPPDMHDGPCPLGRRSEGATHNEACYLRSDIKHMLQYCTGVVMVPGWVQSWGARKEMDVALTCGLEVYLPSLMVDGPLVRAF